MFSSLVHKTHSQIQVIRDFIKIHDDAMREVSGSRANLKVFSVSSCVTRLYAVYENFIESVISDYLDILVENLRYSELSDGFKSEYRVGISHILQKIDQGRYEHLQHEKIIHWYHEALRNNEKYRFVTDALTRHEQNLRLNIVNNLLAKIDLKNLQEWISKNNHTVSLFPDEESTYTRLESEIKNFVQLRNDASHGVLDSLDGSENLERFCTLVEKITSSIACYLSHSIILIMESKGNARRVGQVTEVFGQSGAFILKGDTGETFSINEKLYFIGNSYSCSQGIESIRISDQDVQSFTITTSDDEVGLKCSQLIKKKSKVYKLASA